MLYGRFVKDKRQVRTPKMNYSCSNGASTLLFNRNNMNQNLKDKLNSFYNDVMTPSINKNRANSNTKILIFPNSSARCEQSSNYEDLKKREQINKTKNEIFDILKKPNSSGGPKKTITKSNSCASIFRAYNNNACLGIKNEINKILDRKTNTSLNNNSKVDFTSYRKEIEMGYDYLSKQNNKKFKYCQDDFYSIDNSKRKNDSMQKLQMMLKLSAI